MFAPLRFVSLLCISTVLSFLTLSVHSAPSATSVLVRRQIGDLQCNLDRLAIISALGETRRDVNNITAAGADDLAIVNATAEATSGLDSADDAILDILQAIFADEQAPPEAREQVGDGLTTILNALNSINSTNPDVTYALTQAQSNLNNAILAGDAVVADCK